MKLTRSDVNLGTGRVVPDGLLCARLGVLEEGGGGADRACVVAELEDHTHVRMGGAIQGAALKGPAR